MADLQTIRNRVLDDLLRTGQYTAQAELAINTAVRFYAQQTWWFGEQRATASTVADQEYYDLPADFADMQTLRCNYNNNEYLLNERTMEEMDRLYAPSSVFTSFPTDFCIHREQLRLGPIPNDAYTLTLAYRRAAISLDSDSATNYLSTNAEELLRRHAEMDMALNTIYDDQVASRAAAQAQRLYKMLQGENTLRLVRGHTKPRS